MTEQAPSELRRVLAHFGAPAQDVVLLQEAPGPEHIRYLDLFGPRRDDTPRPVAVVELQDRPVLYVAQGTTTRSLGRLRQILALRGDADFLAVIEPGRLTVHTIRLAHESEVSAPEVIPADSPRAPAVIPEIALAPPEVVRGRSAGAAVHNFLLNLLNEATTLLSQCCNVGNDDALSFVGRALFMRFLVDRDILADIDFATVCPAGPSPQECFSSPAAAMQTSAWLDATFNGNLLPLSGPRTLDWFSSVGKGANARVYETLTNIMHGATADGQLHLPWAMVDFSFVPVGLLSQVYEHHCHTFYPELARGTSVYYTPRYIAEYVVDEAFAGLERADEARVLDPAAGAGVFLVAAFRRIVAERWRRTGKRPDSDALREILRTQLAGFDINEPALRLTALSLYLTALELDPWPHPVSKLKFENLRGVTLFNVDERPADARTAADRWPAGSFGPAVGREHDGRYDLVVGNPPWTSWKSKFAPTGWDATIRPIVDARLPSTWSPPSGKPRAESLSQLPSPDLVPDLPFVWKAMAWARPGGRIALALHGRLLFKQSGPGQDARDAVMHAVRVTGIMNGAALIETAVWPGVKAPFCILFAENKAPDVDSAFYFVSPAHEDRLNGRGRLRIDASSAQPISVSELSGRPYLLKTLHAGTPLDVGVVDKIRGRKAPPIGGEAWREQGLRAGQGYQTSSATRHLQSAAKLHGLPNLRADQRRSFLVETSALEKFNRPKVLYPRDLAIYRAPIVLVSQSPHPERDEGRARLALEDVAYSESFYGYSCAECAEPRVLARLLLLLFNSSLAFYVGLMTSSRFGVERGKFQKEEFDELPVPLPKHVGDDVRREARDLEAELLHGTERPWKDIDAWAARLYGLDLWDVEVMEDALEVALPFESSWIRAQMPPTAHEMAAFATRIQRDIGGVLQRLKISVTTRPSPLPVDAPWRFITIAAESRADVPSVNLEALVREADDLSASLIVVPDVSKKTLLIGAPAQYRYWTRTRARMCALTVLREHLHVFTP